MKTWQSHLTILFIHDGAKTSHFGDTGRLTDMNTCFWGMDHPFWASDMLLQVIHQVLQFALIVLRNALTAVQMLIVMWEKHQSNWEKL